MGALLGFNALFLDSYSGGRGHLLFRFSLLQLLGGFESATFLSKVSFISPPSATGLLWSALQLLVDAACALVTPQSEVLEQGQKTRAAEAPVASPLANI